MDFRTMLSLYQEQMDMKIRVSLASFGVKSILRDACEYALTNGGKRFRPALVLMIAKALNAGVDVSEAALAVEFFHTASLVADDLPCMDDDEERRSKPAVHKVFGEATALLVSYALIASGYECLGKNSQIIKYSMNNLASSSDQMCVLALENVTYNTGILGATGGQFLDIYPPNLSIETLREVIQKKTVSLFEISFVLGWIFGGGAFEQLPEVKQAAAHFGMAFQIADDLGDVSQDIENERQVNLATVLGIEPALKLFYEEIEQFLMLIKRLSIDSTELASLATYMMQKVKIY